MFESLDRIYFDDKIGKIVWYVARRGSYLKMEEYN